MARQVIDAQADSTANIEAVWALLVDVETWTGWAQFEEASYEREGSPDRHGLGAVRRFRVAGMSSREPVLAYEAPSRFAYGYEGTLPIDNYRGEVTLTATASGTHIAWHSEFDPRYAVTGPFLRAFLQWVLTGCAARLAREAEAREVSHAA